MHPEIVPWRLARGKTYLAALLLAACGDNTRIDMPGIVAITGDSPLAGSCSNTGAKSHVYLGLELEPSLAIDPNDDTHLVAAWQQDRWSDGGAQAIGTAVSSDGGATWTRSLPRFSACAHGDFDRASDPWVAFSADGAPYQIAIAFDANTSRSAVLAASSPDSGVTWGDPVALISDNDPDVFNDKDALTADPHTPGRLYAVWDRLTGLTQPNQPIGTGPAMMARATGGTWEPARPIYDPGVDSQTLGNVIAVLPDGTLVDAFDAIHMTSSQNPTFDLQVVRSIDGGDTWSQPIEIATPRANGTLAPDGVGVRDGSGLPAIAADPTSNTVYVAWQDSRFSPVNEPVVDGIIVSRSRDGGMTWDPPVAVNGQLGIPAFTPQIAVAADGMVGVTYYDFRDGKDAAAWLATSSDGGATWTDQRLSEPFALSAARVDNYYFLGDYQGLVTQGAQFVALFALAFVETDPTDIVVSR